ncbi:MAG: hypothetical protein HC836_35375, partial [Richelia sp. RM2_1_2]|nr:hypothetical protein [Richelia sp. RM2_1_2]
MFEDVAKAKKILKDLNIPETDPRYTKLRKLLEKNIGYLGAFVNFMFNDRVEYDELVALYQRMQTDKGLFAKLPKPFIQYNSYLELQDDLNKAEQEVKYQKAFKLFPKNVREVLTRDMTNELRDKIISLSDEFIGVYDRLASKENKTAEQQASDQEELSNFYAGFATLTNNNGTGAQIDGEGTAVS